MLPIVEVVGQRKDGWDVYSFLEAVRRRWKIVLACSVLVPLAAVGLSLTQRNMYTATAAVLFRDPGFDQKIFGAPVFQPTIDPAREAATNVRLIGLRTVSDSTGRRLGVSGSEVASKVSIQAQGNSDIVSIAATDRTPAAAVRLADTYANEYLTFRRQADQRKILGAASLVSGELATLHGRGGDAAQRPQLQHQLDQLTELAALQTGNAELVQSPDKPSSPSSPQTVRNAVLGLLMGVLIGIALALVLDRIDRRLRDPEDVQEIFDRPILALVPESPVFGRQTRGQRLGRAESEQFRMLRTSLLYFNVEKDIRSLLITSSAQGEGKSTVAWNLAAAAAAGGGDVLLIEADLRRPNLSRLTSGGAREGAGPGLSQVLSGELDAPDATFRVPVETGDNGTDEGPAVHVMFSGPLPPNPGGMLESRRMNSLIKEAEEHYDLVIIDSSPTSVVPDAVPLIKEVSGVIVVSRLGLATRDAARQLRDQLQNLDAPTLGIVINGVEQWRDRYNYAYAYAADTGRNGKWLRRRRSKTPV